MIFVTVGTHHQPFDRLIEAVTALPHAKEAVFQYGVSKPPKVAREAAPYFGFDENVAHLKAAEVVITHAGTASVMLALSLGHRPIVAARLKQFGEHVDDHQMELVNTLRELDLIEAWLPGDALDDLLPKAKRAAQARVVAPSVGVVSFLENLIETNK